MALTHFYRVTATGQWCGAGHSKSQSADWIARYEEALGLAPGSIEEVESASDPRTGTLLTEPPPPGMPDVGNFKLALYAPPEMGGLGKVKVRALTSDYPDSVDSLNAGNFAVFRSSVEDMLTDMRLTQAEYDIVHALMATFNIPEA